MFPIMLPQRRKRKLDFFVVVGYNPSGKYIIFPSLLDSMVSHSLISATSMFSHQVRWWGECCCYSNCWSYYSLTKSILAQNTGLVKWIIVLFFFFNTKTKIIRTAFIKNTAPHLPTKAQLCVLYFSSVMSDQYFFQTQVLGRQYFILWISQQMWQEPVTAKEN